MGDGYKTSALSLVLYSFFACGNIKNTSKLLAEEEEKDVDI